MSNVKPLFFYVPAENGAMYTPAEIGVNCHGGCSSPKVHNYDWEHAEIRNDLLTLSVTGKEELAIHVPFCHKEETWSDDWKDEPIDRIYPVWDVGDKVQVRGNQFVRVLKVVPVRSVDTSMQFLSSHHPDEYPFAFEVHYEPWDNIR